MELSEPLLWSSLSIFPFLCMYHELSKL
jgi:hypothetical protein